MATVLRELTPPVILVETLDEVGKMVSAYHARPDLPLAFDIETTGLDPRAGKLVTLQFAQRGHSVSVIDARRLPPGPLGLALAGLFEGEFLIVGHNLKFDFGWLMEKLGIYPTRCFDTLLAEQVIHGLGRSEANNRGMALNLKALAHRYLDRDMSKEERNWFIDLDQREEEWAGALPVGQITYAAADVLLLPDLYDIQLAELKRRTLTQPARLEMAALPAIASIEQSGVGINVEGWRAFIAEKEAEAAEIESEALAVFGGAVLAARAKVFDAKLAVYQQWEASKQAEERRLRAVFDEGLTATNEYQPPKWGEFKVTGMQMWRTTHPNPGKPKPDTSVPNIGSSAQLQHAFAEMGIPLPTKLDPKTKERKPTTESEALESLEDDHPSVKLLLDYRRAAKFVTSFGESLLRFVTPAGRIHPEYVQIGASTGRMSCTRPNWQQVPSKGDGKRLRELVVAGPRNVLLTADFSNIELRILADISGDETMLRLFATGEDLHSYTARMMFGLGNDVDVKHTLMPGSDQTYRAVAKVINFGLAYGMSAPKLSRAVHVSRERAQELMDAHFALYPGVATWMRETKRTGFDKLESRTLSGRKRYYTDPEEGDDYRMLKARIERQSMNTPIQGTSADITKQALVNLYRGGLLQNQFGLAQIVAVVHDEIVLECEAENAALVSAALTKAMGDAAEQYLKRVTLPPVEVVVSEHWSKE